MDKKIAVFRMGQGCEQTLALEGLYVSVEEFQQENADRCPRSDHKGGFTYFVADMVMIGGKIFVSIDDVNSDTRCLLKGKDDML